MLRNLFMAILHKLEEKHFIEDIGLFFEQMGMPRMAGRILGSCSSRTHPTNRSPSWLEKLQASKSSISIMAPAGGERLIEKAPSALPRRDYYRFKTGGWLIYMRQWL
jgi:DNA-binding transcriptional regulator GbsR (MarR family)